jgi:hypothetical protein
MTSFDARYPLDLDDSHNTVPDRSAERECEHEDCPDAQCDASLEDARESMEWNAQVEQAGVWS